MKILLAASEVAPIIKFGGLGDVTGSLPKAIEKLGVDIDVIAPFFPSLVNKNCPVYKSYDINVPFNEEINTVEVWKAKLPGSNVDVFLLKNAKYFSNYSFTNPNGSMSDTEVFSFFNRAVVEYIKSKFNTYDLIHCNDWHTGIINHIMEEELDGTRPATLLTIHNLMYQGIGKPELVWELGLTPGEHPMIDWDIADGDLNMLQQGIASSDYLNAVSPTYAQEILTPEFGANLCDLLNSRVGRLTGILNGIDYSAFPRDYDAETWSQKKPQIKQKLLKDLNIKNTSGPVYSFIGRLDPNQKGLDIMFDAVNEIVHKGGSFILLGSGDKTWEEKFKSLSGENVSINLKFDVEFAKTIYSGSDFLLVPSKYEPCGLIQMIAMWYGTLPVVHNVGGLKDSVIDGIDGFKFDEYTTTSLLSAVDKANNVYNGQGLSTMIDKAIKKDFTWDRSALEYKALYEKVINLHEKSL